MYSNTILAIDIGAQKIKAAVAHKDEEDALHILGLGTSKTDGFSNGAVKDMTKLTNSIRLAITALEEHWGEDIDPSRMPAFYSISGKDVFYQNVETDTRQIANVTHEAKIGSVSAVDIEWLKGALEATNIPDTCKKISVISQCYQIDRNNAIENPIGLNGREIKAAGLLITDSKSHIADLERAITVALTDNEEFSAGESIELIPVAASIASAMSVLSSEEKENGAAILDMGKGCCDLAVFYKEYPILACSKEFAGEFITREIKNILTTSPEEAEDVKLRYAYATPTKAGSKETFQIRGKEPMPLENLAQWVYVAVKYLFENAKKSMNNNFYGSNFNNIISQTGVVLTGGTANLKDITLVAQEVLEVPVKIGKPNAVKIAGAEKISEDMSYSTLLGLCVYGMQNYDFKETSGTKRKKKKPSAKAKSGGAAEGKVKSFFKDLTETIKNIKIS